MNNTQKLTDLDVGWNDKHAILTWMINKYEKRYLRFTVDVLNHLMFLLQESLGFNSLDYEFLLKHDRGIISYEVENDVKILQIRYLVEYNEKTGLIARDEEFEDFLRNEDCMTFLEIPAVKQALKTLDDEYAGWGVKDLGRVCSIIHSWKTRDKTASDKEFLRFMKKTTFWQSKSELELSETFEYLKDQNYLR
jgi:hypothetical protein